VVQKEQTLVHFCYAIPYRRQRGNVEFCLFVFPGDRDWDFPHAVEPDDSGEETAELLLTPCHKAGLDGRIDDVPLGQFEASRGDMVEMVTAYLVEAAPTDAPVNGSPRPRHRWCLLEEAKLRIRRKPLRHLLDVAQRRLTQPG
jgi:hypothetical protein